MGRRPGFISFSSKMKEAKHASPSSSSSPPPPPPPPPLPWRTWPSCKHPKTLSFREDGFVASRLVLSSDEGGGDDDDDAVVEAAVRRLRASERLFLEPCGLTTSSIVPFEGAVAVAVESEDPRRDFRRSMEEMVAARGGARELAWLEEMLGWYLRANGKSAHGIIIRAFVELLLSTPQVASSSSSSSCSCSSTTCSSSRSFVSETGEEQETCKVDLV